jgi:hypothetical protein
VTDLSPAAQAVLNVFGTHPLHADHISRDLVFALAAALRAAADQSIDIDVPFAIVNDWESVEGTCARFYAAAEWGYKQALKRQRAIATELEALPG